MTPTVDPRAALSTELAGRYTVTRELGRGGMGVVYLGFDERHHREVAIKVLSEALSSAIGAQRFLSEIRTTAGLSHPHIIPLIDSGEADGRLYYIMPYVQGESLRQRLHRQSRMPVAEALRIATEVSDALGYSHALGVIHRDVKPDNILLTGNGHAWLSDFGIAWSLERRHAPGLTATDAVIGTPLYMSPEQAVGGELDARSDVYSLGCVLYEMLVGEVPKIGSGTPSLRRRRADVSRGLEETVSRALELDPDRRFETAAELEEALRRCGVGAGGAAGAGGERPLVGGGGARATGAWAGADGPIDRVLRAVLYVGAVTVGLTTLGMASTAMLDATLHIPPMYRPSRTDHLVVGAQALVPVMLWTGVLVAGYLIAKHLLGFVRTALGSESPTGRGPRAVLSRTLAGWSRRIHRLREPRLAGAVADGFLLGALALSAGAIWTFRDLLMLPAGRTEVLGCSNRSAHVSYWLSLTLLLGGLGFIRHRLFRFLDDGARKRIRSFDAARWGTLVLLGVLLVVTALPWRTLFNSKYERARVDGRRAYVLAETDDEVLIHIPETRTTNRYSQAEIPDFQLLGTTGYVFEEPQIFDGGLDSCFPPPPDSNQETT